METTFSNNYIKYDVKTSNKSSCGLQALNKFYEIILLNVHLVWSTLINVTYEAFIKKVTAG